MFFFKICFLFPVLLRYDIRATHVLSTNPFAPTYFAFITLTAKPFFFYEFSEENKKAFELCNIILSNTGRGKSVLRTQQNFVYVIDTHILRWAPVITA